MDRFGVLPSWAHGEPCDICGSEVEPRDAPVFGDYDYATDTGASVQIRHGWCHETVQRARAQALRDAANLVAATGTLPEVVRELRRRAVAAEERSALAEAVTR